MLVDIKERSGIAGIEPKDLKFVNPDPDAPKWTDEERMQRAEVAVELILARLTSNLGQMGDILNRYDLNAQLGGMSSLLSSSAGEAYARRAINWATNPESNGGIKLSPSTMEKAQPYLNQGK